MKSKEKYLTDEVAVLTQLINELHERVVRIKFTMLAMDDMLPKTASKPKLQVVSESSLPRLDEAIACISTRYSERDEMAKLVIRNRDAGRLEILKLCQARGWISPNTGIDNVRFIDKILNLFPKGNS